MVGNNPVSTKKRAKIKDLLERLRDKLKDFVIINMQGQVLGRVKDIVLDRSYHLNVVISREEAEAGSPRYLLSSQYIEHIDTSNRSIFVDLTVTELEHLPVYSIDNNRVTASSDRSPNPAVTQASTTTSGEAGKLNEAHSLETETPTEGGSETLAESDDRSNVLEEEIVRLLEERLVVNRSKRKVGEVVVRKEIETRIVEVPIQREKLIIEQVGEETKTLAEIDLGEGDVTGVELANVPSSEIHEREGSRIDKGNTVIGEFVSPKAASNLLEAIALQRHHGCEKVRVELVVEDPELRETYQTMFDRCSIL